jgi:Flp pilus assembly pilin Flp
MITWSHIRRFVGNDDGLEAVEYAVLLGLIVVAVIGVMASIGAWVTNIFATVQNDLGA